MSTVGLRISSQQYYDIVTTALNGDQSDISNILTQLSTGQEYTLPSQNPVATVQLLSLTSEQDSITQYQSNIQTVTNQLSSSESYLTGMVNDIESARDLLVEAANGSNSQVDENSIAGSLAPIISSILASANIQNSEGTYIFSGTLTNTPTITYNAAAAVGAQYTWTGNNGTQLVNVNTGMAQPANVTLPTVANLLNALGIVQNTLSSPTVDVSNPTTNATIEGAVNTLDSVLNDVNSTIASIGGTQNIIGTLNSNLQDLSVANQSAADSIGQVNYAEAETSLSSYNTALEATQKAYASVSQLSLWNDFPG